MVANPHGIALVGMKWFWDQYTTAKPRRVGIEVTQVRYGGIIHDFVMVNSMHDTPQSKAAVAQAVAPLKRLLAA